MTRHYAKRTATDREIDRNDEELRINIEKCQISQKPNV